MKRMMICFFSLLSVLLLSACGAKADSASTSTSTSTSDISTQSERQEIVLAVAASGEDAESGSADSVFGGLLDLYNQQSEEYCVVTAPYADETALQLMIASNEVDMICWDSYAASLQDEPASAQIYGAKGYLEDLEALLASGDTIDLSGFIPRVLELEKQTYGGVYTLPTTFYARTLIGNKSYVGTEHGWTLEDVLETAEQLPEDVILYDGLTQSGFLDMMLDCVLSDFMDIEAGSYQFQTEEFYDLLRLCKDYFPETLPEEETREAALQVVAIMGPAGQFGESTLAEEASGTTCVIGYPKALGQDGNGANLIFADELSVCTNAKNQAGALDFLAYVFSTEGQAEVATLMSPVQSIFDESESSYQKQSEICTQEISEQSKNYIYEASSVMGSSDSPVKGIILEEAAAYFSDDKTAEEVAALIADRVKIYMAEQG